ncbi:MAG TPA: hypothetical protein VJ227_04225 [Patescibacteria group bacterium]|nr:hypothetical protein [Patescibacteria group bacterium]
MKIEVNETPEERFGDREVPYHQTGRVPIDELLKALKPNDLKNILLIKEYVDSTRDLMKTPVIILIVGSAANVSVAQYRDIDLLVCPEDKNARTAFAQRVTELLVNDRGFKTRIHSKKSSVLFERDLLYGPFKLFVEPNNENAVGFDITFLGVDGGTIEDTIRFHEVNRLSYSIFPQDHV